VDEVLQFGNYVLLHQQLARFVLDGPGMACFIKIKRQQGDEPTESEPNQLFSDDDIG
jgi:hypothetical protein